MSNKTEKAKGLKDNEVGQSDVDPVVVPLAAMKERLQKKLKNNRKRSRNLKRPVPSPRYDDVYFEGIDWLNRNG